MTLSGAISSSSAHVLPRASCPGAISTAIVPAKKSNMKQQKSKVWNFLGHKLAGLASVHARSKQKKLVEVVSKGNLADVVEHLASIGPLDQVTVKSPLNQSALYVAASRGFNQILTLLLDRGANVNETTPEGLTALHAACENNRDMAVRILLKHNAQVNAVAQNGLRPLHVATLKSHVQIVELLLKNGAEIDAEVPGTLLTPLMIACKAGASELVEVLLDAGADPHMEDHEGNTPLHFSCEFGHYRATYLLLTAGADPYMPNVREDTAFEVAEANGHSHIAYLLETNGMGDKVQEMDQAFVQDEQLNESIQRNRPEIAEIIVKNRLKYAKFYVLGCVKEDEAVEVFALHSVETEL